MSRGINKITLYEGKGIFFRYLNDTTIGQVSTMGERYQFDLCFMPQIVTEIRRENGQRLYDRELTLQLRTKSEYQRFRTILNNYTGWYVIFEDMDGNEYFILDPFRADSADQNFSQGVNYQLTLNHFVPSNNKQVLYINSEFLTVDQTDITVDSTLITADQTIE